MREFDEVLDQIVALLQQRGKMTYRALTLQFDLNDETLETMKDELLFAHPVVDEADRGLVWVGEADAPPASIATTPQPDITLGNQPSLIELSSESHTPDAERRQPTEMFCDLADSTKLSQQLDPEDLREVVRAYQQTCPEVEQRFDGHVAQLLGDALLVYFGWSQAHEDDAPRADG